MDGEAYGNFGLRIVNCGFSKRGLAKPDIVNPQFEIPESGPLPLSRILQRRSIASCLVDLFEKGLPLQVVAQVLTKQRHGAVEIPRRGTGHMRGDDHVLKIV